MGLGHGLSEPWFSGCLHCRLFVSGWAMLTRNPVNNGSAEPLFLVKCFPLWSPLGGGVLTVVNKEGSRARPSWKVTRKIILTKAAFHAAYL